MKHTMNVYHHNALMHLKFCQNGISSSLVIALVLILNEQSKP